MQIIEANREALRRLAALRANGAKVLSVYLNLDPSEFPTPQARRRELESLMAGAERRYLKNEDLSHDGKVALRQDIQNVRDFFQGEHYTIEGAQAVAVFCCGPTGLFDVVKLPRGIESMAVVDDSPFVEPLTGALSSAGWCILLVNRRTGRIFRGSPERLEEIGNVRDIVHRWHDQGGWSQSRYQRGIEKEIQDHVKHSCEVLFDVFKADAFERLIVGAPRELWPEVESRLHPYLKGRLAGRIEVDVEHTSAEEVRREVVAVVGDHERRAERQALDRLSDELGNHGRAAGGLEAVLAALNERRVDLLLHERGFKARGVACPACGWVGLAGEECPVDGGATVARDDVVERAVELALAQSAEVLPVRHHDDLRRLGSVAALLRF